MQSLCGAGEPESNDVDQPPWPCLLLFKQYSPKPQINVIKPSLTPLSHEAAAEKGRVQGRRLSSPLHQHNKSPSNLPSLHHSCVPLLPPLNYQEQPLNNSQYRHVAHPREEQIPGDTLSFPGAVRVAKPRGWGPHGRGSSSAGWGWRNPAAGAKSAQPVLLGLMLSALINPIKIQLGAAHLHLPGKRGRIVVFALSSVTRTQSPAGSAASSRKR